MNTNKKLISILTPCYNEEESVEKFYKTVKKVTDKIYNYQFEHIFIDNASQDNTVSILKKFSKEDRNLKIIINERNFGYLRSPYYGLLQTSGEAVISMACDLQDPPEMIQEFISGWEEGIPVVIGIKTSSSENILMYKLRTFYYNLLDRYSDIDQIKNFTGFGLFDKRVINELRLINEPYPYLRGLIAELGFRRKEIEFHQPKREKGKTNSSWPILYDLAVLGFVNHSKVPLRFATLIGTVTAFVSFSVGLIYLIYKIFYWDDFLVGMAPVAIGLFFISSVQLIFLGIIGEYIGVTLTNSKTRPLVVERERINF